MINKKNYWLIVLLAIAAGMVLAAGCTTTQAADDKVFLEKAEYHTITVNGTMYELMTQMNEMEIGGSIVKADELKAEADAATADLSNLTVSPQRQAYKDELLQAFSNLSRGASSVNESLTLLSNGNQEEAIRVSEEGGPLMDLGVEHLEKAKLLIGGSGIESFTTVTPPINWDNIPIMDYDTIFRYNENHIGDLVKLKGQILEVQSVDGDNYILRIATKKSEYGNSYYDNVVWVNYKGSRVLEKDIVDIYGRVKGLKEYTAVLGNTITIPEIDALKLDLIEKAS